MPQLRASRLWARAARASAGPVVLVAVILLSGLPEAQVVSERDPAYWIGRLEQALLPRSSMRASFVLDSEGRTGFLGTWRARLARVQGPDRLRSVVGVESPPSERRVLRIVSAADGQTVDQTLYESSGDVRDSSRRASDPFLGSALTYEDLGFVALDHRAENATVDLENLPGGRVVRVTTGPYGPYGKVVTRLDAKTGLPRRVEFFDEAGGLRRTVEYRRVEERGAWPLPMLVEAAEVGSGRKSRLRFVSIELGAAIPDEEFEPARLTTLIEEIEAGAAPGS